MLSSMMEGAQRQQTRADGRGTNPNSPNIFNASPDPRTISSGPFLHKSTAIEAFGSSPPPATSPASSFFRPLPHRNAGSAPAVPAAAAAATSVIGFGRGFVSLSSSPYTFLKSSSSSRPFTTRTHLDPEYPKPLDAFIQHSPFNSSIRAHMDVQQTAPVVRIGTRSSALARKQSGWVAVELLRLSDDGAQAEEVPVLTAGDRDKISPMSTMGKGLWTTDLENMMLNNEIDLVVHSLKDLATTMPDGCALGAITRREDPRDVLVVRENLRGIPEYAALATMPPGSVIGTSSVRRAAQMRRLYPHLEFLDMRGNIDTRLRKLHERDSRYTGLVLAAAGLLRMGFGEHITQYLDRDNGGIMHAVGQGALGIQVRVGDEATIARVLRIEDRDTSLACTAERAVMRVLEGGCSVPIGVETKWVEVDGQRKLRFRTIVISLDGSEGVEHEIVDVVETKADAEAMGKKMAATLVDMGASKILDVIKAQRSE